MDRPISADDRHSEGEEMNVVSATRNAVDARKWVAAKLLPKKYGDRPAEVNVNTQINLMQVSVEDQRRIQEARLKLLQGDTNTTQ